MKKYKTAFLINPPTGLYIREERCQGPVEEHVSSSIRPPIDLMYYAAALEKRGLSCYIKDYPIKKNSNWKIFERDLKKYDPDILLISITSMTLADDIKSLEIAKRINPSILTVVKGAHTNIYDRQILERYGVIDIILRGEAELTIGEIGQGKNLGNILGITYRKNGKVIRNPDRPFTEDLDSIPFPARHLVNNNNYLRPDTNEPQTTIQTNRGCPMSCIFCLAQVVAGNKVRSRSPKNIVDEIEECVNKFNIKNFFFKADTFTWDKKWVIEVCKEIINRKLQIKWVSTTRVDKIDEERLSWMKKAGCWLLAFGIESGNKEILNKIKKQATLEQAKSTIKLCKKMKIKTLSHTLVGFPWDNKNTIHETIKFLKETNGDFFEVRLCIPFPGTELERIEKELGLLPPKIINDYDYFGYVPKTLYLDEKKVLSLRKKAILTLLFRPKYIFKTLLSNPSPKVITNYISFGIRKLINLLKPKPEYNRIDTN